MPKGRFDKRSNVNPSVLGSLQNTNPGGLARGLQQAGRNFERMSVIQRRRELDQERREARMYSDKSFNEYHEQITNLKNDMVKNGVSGRDIEDFQNAKDFVANFMDSAVSISASYLDGAPSDSARELLNSRITSYHIRLREQIIDAEQKVKTAIQTNILNGVIDRAANFALNNPSEGISAIVDTEANHTFPLQNDDEIAKLDEQGLRSLSTSISQKFVDLYKTRVGYSAVTGLIDQDPDVALQLMDAGAFNDILAPNDLIVLSRRAEAKKPDRDLYKIEQFKLAEESSLQEHLENGSGRVLTIDDFTEVYGSDNNEAKARHFAYENKRLVNFTLYKEVESLKFSSPDTRQFRVDNAKVFGLDNTEENKALANDVRIILKKTNATITSEIADDPANYVLNVGKHQDTIKRMEINPEKGIDSMLHVQRNLLKVPEGDVRILPKDDVKKLAQFVNDIKDPLLFRMTVQGFNKRYGKYWDGEGLNDVVEPLYNLMVSEGNLNSNYAFAIANMDSVHFNMIFNGARIDPNIIDKELESKGVSSTYKDIREEVSDAMEEYFGVLQLAGKNSAEMISYISQMTDVLSRTAVTGMLTNPDVFDGEDAVEFVVTEFIDKRFDVMDETYVVPKNTGSAETSNISSYIGNELDARLKPEFLKDRIIPFTGVTTTFTGDDKVTKRKFDMQDTLDQVKRHGIWLNTHDFSGVQLYIKRPDQLDVIPVLGRDGKILEFKFEELLERRPLADHRTLGEELHDIWDGIARELDALSRIIPSPVDRGSISDARDKPDPVHQPPRNVQEIEEFKRQFHQGNKTDSPPLIDNLPLNRDQQ